jgi:hypothetical protein
MTRSASRITKWPLIAALLATVVILVLVGFAWLRGWALATHPSDLGVFGSYLGGVLGAGFGLLSIVLLTQSLKEARAASSLAAAQAMIAGIEALDRDIQGMLSRANPRAAWLKTESPDTAVVSYPYITTTMSVNPTPSLREMLYTAQEWQASAPKLAYVRRARNELAVSLCRFADALLELDNASNERLRSISDYFRARYRSLADTLSSQCDGLEQCLTSLHLHVAGPSEREFTDALTRSRLG